MVVDKSNKIIYNNDMDKETEKRAIEHFRRLSEKNEMERYYDELYADPAEKGLIDYMFLFLVKQLSRLDEEYTRQHADNIFEAFILNYKSSDAGRTEPGSVRLGDLRDTMSVASRQRGVRLRQSMIDWLKNTEGLL